MQSKKSCYILFVVNVKIVMSWSRVVEPLLQQCRLYMLIMCMWRGSLSALSLTAPTFEVLRDCLWLTSTCMLDTVPIKFIEGLDIYMQTCWIDSTCDIPKNTLRLDNGEKYEVYI